MDSYFAGLSDRAEKDPYAYIDDEYAQGLLMERETLRQMGCDTAVITALINARIAQLNGVQQERSYDLPTDDNLWSVGCTEDL